MADIETTTIMIKIFKALAALALAGAILIPDDGTVLAITKGLCAAMAVNLTVAAARCKP